jgi:hypothetical protein
MPKKLMKKCLISLAINEMQIKSTLRVHFTPVRMAVIKNTNNNRGMQGNKEPSYTAEGNVNYYNFYEKQYGGTSKTKSMIQ